MDSYRNFEMMWNALDSSQKGTHPKHFTFGEWVENYEEFMTNRTSWSSSG